MNNTFKLSRLQLLLKKQWIENRKIYFATTAILFGLIALFYAFNLVNASLGAEGTAEFGWNLVRFSSLPFREPVLMISGMFYLCLLSGHYFSNLGKASTAIQELTLPVSVIEKVVCSFLLSILLTVLTFVITFLIIDTISVSLLREVYKGIEIDEISDRISYYSENSGFKFFLETLDIESITIISLIGLLLSSVFILGSVYFSRFSFIKTGFFVVLFVGLIAFSVTSLERLINNDRISIVDPSRNNTIKVFITVLVIAIVVSIWSAIYFRLKEKEV